MSGRAPRRKGAKVAKTKQVAKPYEPTPREGFRMRMIRKSQREEIRIALSEADEAGEPGLTIIGPAPEPQGLRAVPQQGAAP